MRSSESVKFIEKDGDVVDSFEVNNKATTSTNIVDPNCEESPIRSLNNSEPLLDVTLKQEQLHCIYREYDAVVKNFIEGVYITPGAESPLIWFGLIVVRTGIFYGGLFRFTITIPEEFPDTVEVPIVQFEEPLFHPLVNPKTNCVDLNRFFPSGWQRDRNHIYQVITATQGIFFRCQSGESSLAANPEAAILLKENRSKFVQLAHNAVRSSRTQIYAMPASDDQNAIRFTPWDDVEMEPYRQYLLGRKELPENKKLDWKKQKKGLSWVKNGNDDNLWFYLCDD